MYSKLLLGPNKNLLVMQYIRDQKSRVPIQYCSYHCLKAAFYNKTLMNRL